MRKPNYITPSGYQTLLDELEVLTNKERPKIVEEVRVAAAHGDRSENAEYIYGKKRLREIDERMRELKKRLNNAKVVDPSEDRGDRIFFGATVVLEDLDSGRESRYQLVGADEADARTGLISFRSPVGQALMGREVGDEVTVETPRGIRNLMVAEVRYE